MKTIRKIRRLKKIMYNPDNYGINSTIASARIDSLYAMLKQLEEKHAKAVFNIFCNALLFLIIFLLISII